MEERSNFYSFFLIPF